MKLLNPLRIACNISDKSYVWAGEVSDGEGIKLYVAPSYIWAGQMRSGKIK